jgi:GAF domain-containing protein
MAPATLGVYRPEIAGRTVPLMLPGLCEVQLDGHADRVSRVARQALGAEASVVALVSGDLHLVVGHEGRIPELDTQLRFPSDGPCGGQVELVERGNPDAAWVAAYAGTPVEVRGQALMCLAAVLRSDGGTWSGRDLARLDEFATLAATVIATELRDEASVRVEELVPRLAAPLGDLGDAVRNATDLVETPQDPRLPRMADVVRHRLEAVELLAGQLDEARSDVARSAKVHPRIDLTELLRFIVARYPSAYPRAEPLLDLPDRPVWVRQAGAPLDRALSRLVSAAVCDGDTAMQARVRLTEADDVGTVEVDVPGRGVPLPGLLRLVGAVTTLAAEPAPVSVRLDPGLLQVHAPGLEARTDASGSVITVTLPVETVPALDVRQPPGVTS